MNICYLPAGGAEGPDMWDAAGGEYSVERFDPKTGRTSKGDPIKGGNRHVMQAPWEGPAVLFIQGTA